MGKATQCARKLEAVIAAKKHGITEVAKIYGITRTTLTPWIKRIKNDMIERLNTLPERKRKPKLNDDQRKQMLEWIQGNSQLTINAIRIKIEQMFMVSLSKSTVHREVQKLRYSNTKQRPKHFTQDSHKVSVFKKNIR